MKDGNYEAPHYAVLFTLMSHCLLGTNIFTSQVENLKQQIFTEQNVDRQTNRVNIYSTLVLCSWKCVLQSVRKRI
jgi:hypothetical protein